MSPASNGDGDGEDDVKEQGEVGGLLKKRPGEDEEEGGLDGWEE